MNREQFDVVIVGAGAAGVSAALGLTRFGFSVAVVEAAAYPGAENWSGCVYFCENLAHPDILGPDGVEQLAWERRLIERGFFATDGYGLLGTTYRDPAAFRHCYTVLRPIYDRHLALLAQRQGVVLFASTTAESLIRDGRRIIGVCTNRGALYGRLVFLAEGDASHLVSREGYERLSEPKRQPKFLQGIKQIWEFPPNTIEERFGLGPQDGAAYEMLLRNGTLRGRRVRLNAGGFLYTNRTSLSIGLVLPVDNLHENFKGDPNLLMEWFQNIPALRHWLRGGKPGVFGAKIIRGGGAREIPTLVDDGLAIGGAAGGVGVDFPYPNFTGPATAMGLLLVQAAIHIREEGGDFTRDNLRRQYLQPLQETHYWKDVEFLHRWPGYVEKTKSFFGVNIDFTLQSTYLWTRSKHGLFQRWRKWVTFLLGTAAAPEWGEMIADSRQLQQALQLGEVFSRPGLWRLLLDGALNSVRDLFHRPRANLPNHGDFRFHYLVAGGEAPAGLPPGPVRRWFARFAPVMAAAARLIYSNNDMPLSQKLPRVAHLLTRQINLIDLLGAGIIAGVTSLWSAVWIGWKNRKGEERQFAATTYGLAEYQSAAGQAGDLTVHLGGATREWEARLARLGYGTGEDSHIHLRWPQALPEKGAIAGDGLWHVCPANVYEARINSNGQLQVVVNFENCIKCETCWRISDLVDWGRDGEHQFIYGANSPAVGKILQELERGEADAGKPPVLIEERSNGRPVARSAVDEISVAGLPAERRRELQRLCENLQSKLTEFDDALRREPRTIDYSRTEYLQMLARYAKQLAIGICDLLQQGDSKRMQRLATETAALTDRRAKHVWNQRFSWAAADGRQLRYHHLPEIMTCLERETTKRPNRSAAAGTLNDDSSDRLTIWLQAERADDEYRSEFESMKDCLDRFFPANTWRDLEKQQRLTSEQDTALLGLLAKVPAVPFQQELGGVHSPYRKLLLAELGRRDPSLGYRAACHLWARDLLSLFGNQDIQLPSAFEKEWTCFAMERGWGEGECWVDFVPALNARYLVLLTGDRLQLIDLRGEDSRDAIQIEPLATLGLRGAGLARIKLRESFTRAGESHANPDELLRAWQILSSADLVSIAFGMTDLLCRRTLDHAATRVQFPGLFHDEQSRDAIGKFGVVKKMIAEMAARRYVMQTLDWTLSPADFSQQTQSQTTLAKALVAELLGTSPGSVSYNAGQVFGGTGYSEDDVLSKYYRDAAAWRFLGPNNDEVYQNRGDELISEGRLPNDMPASLEETNLLNEIQQRQALRAELEEIHNHYRRVSERTRDWLEQCGNDEDRRGSPDPAGLRESLGRQSAWLLAGKAVLLRTHARLEAGISSENETALLRVWLENTAHVLREFDTSVQASLDHHAILEDRPIVDPVLGAPVLRYRDILDHSHEYNSGDFLTLPADPNAPRYVPELIGSDPWLAEREKQIRQSLGRQFRERRNGTLYERFIEKKHRPDESDLDFLRGQGFFRMPIPKELGGEGASKAEYYLLTTNAHRQADVAISLTIQVNTSLGTTPILLARDIDLPRAQKEMQQFVTNETLHTEVAADLKKLESLFEKGNSGEIAKAYQRLNGTLQENVVGRAALRAAAYAFLQNWQQAGAAGNEYELSAMQQAVANAAVDWQKLCAGTTHFLDELARRQEACDLYLRWIASGQISAFALTEPSAGSDTARVATRARLCSVAVEAEDDGSYRFTPAGADGLRYLLDARKLEFRKDDADDGKRPKVFYRWSATAAPSPIQFDEYDYETDTLDKRLYYERDGRRVYFTDISQLRERDGRHWYDYWELTGAKMWITNGRMCGVMCLYAKTAEGITGFLVDRHAEGLTVGKDEEKMGQNGSPTNELSLQGVRVPRENVLGLEGRGQVNALETLNVGRAGLAMSAMSQMRPIIEQCRQFASAGKAAVGRIAKPSHDEWRLQQMEEDCFIAESVAFDVIGRFEHQGTKSVRMESAIAKMLCSELLHRLIETAEEIHGLAGQTQRHLIEKRKRDARVLNIYEGTNEIQRFLILKDLAADVARRWGETSNRPASGYVSREILALENLKANFRQTVDAALELFGQQLWQNPNLQANCFQLCEAAGRILAADSTLARLAWLSRRELAESDDEPLAKIQIGKKAFYRCVLDACAWLNGFEHELQHLRRGFYAAEIRAASLLLAPHLQKKIETPPSRILRRFSILVVMEPPSPGTPNPTVMDGNFHEPYRVFRQADRSALESALRLRETGQAEIFVEVIAAGSSDTVFALREFLSLNVDRVRLLVTPNRANIALDRIGAALAHVLAQDGSYDLILSGSGSESEEGLLAPVVAAALNIAHAGDADAIAVHADERQDVVQLFTDRGAFSKCLPACVSLQTAQPLRSFRVEGHLQGLSKKVETLHWPERVECCSYSLLPQMAAAAAAGDGQTGMPMLPLEASHFVLDAVGANSRRPAIDVSASENRRDQRPVIEDVSKPSFAAAGQTGPLVLAALACDDAGGLKSSAAVTLQAARFLAQTANADVGVLLLAPGEEEKQQTAISSSADQASGCEIVLLPIAAAAAAVNCQLLVECFRQLELRAIAVVGEPWTEAAFITLAAENLDNNRMIARAVDVGRKDRKLAIATTRLGGRFHCEHLIPLDGKTLWLTMREDAAVGAVSDVESHQSARIQRWQPIVDDLYSRYDIQRLLDEIKREAGVASLSDADFIIDVGFGVGNRDGYEEVILPLEQALTDLRVRNLAIGGSRKVTEELHLLPLDRQIGQSGVNVNPRILLAIGVSGAPQHLNYIGGRATIVAFNRDREAPIVTLGGRQSGPRVFAVIGDLFETVPAFIDGLRQLGVAKHDRAGIPIGHF